MTDTPRTRDELLTIFGPGQVGDIGSQDLRDFVVSSPEPFGDEEPLLFAGLGWGYSHRQAIDVSYAGATHFDGTPGEDAVRSGLFISADYTQPSFAPGELAPLLYGTYIESVARNDADGTSAAGFFFVYGAQIIAAADSPGGVWSLTGVLGDANLLGTTGSDGLVENAIGVQGVVDSEEEFTGDVTNATSVLATSLLQNGIDVANYYGVKVDTPINGAGIVNGYGVYVAEMTKGTAQKWNIFSAGAGSKNKLEGRVMQGTPNSAPTDADLGNGQISAYLDQAGNALKYRVKYSDGTLKTGQVALT